MMQTIEQFDANNWTEARIFIDWVKALGWFEHMTFGVWIPCLSDHAIGSSDAHD